jgi:hypothetical protein
MNHVRTLSMTAVMLGAAMLSSACGSGGSAVRLALPGHTGAFGAGLPSTTPAAPYTFGSVFICAHGAHDKPLRVVGVKLLNGNGHLRVDAFGVREAATAFGAAETTLAAAGFPKSTAGVEGTCPAGQGTAGMYEFAIQVSRDTSDDGSASALALEYTSDSHAQQLVVPFALRLCRNKGNCPPPLQSGR